MQTLNSPFRSNISLALDDLLKDVDQIRNLIKKPRWKKLLSKSGEKDDVILSRIVFDLMQANDHIMKTREQLADVISREK